MPNLFDSKPIDTFFEEHRSIIRNAVANLDETILSGTDLDIKIEQIAERFAKEAKIFLIEVNYKMEFDNPIIKHSRTKGFPTAHVKYKMPYGGNGTLLTLIPNGYRNEHTYAVKITDYQIEFDVDSEFARLDIPENQSQTVVETAKNVRALIQQVLPFVIEECNEFNDSLKEFAKEELLKKRQAFKAKMDLRSKLDPND
jgi:hypothetical protein